MWSDSFNLDAYRLQPGKSCEGCGMCCYLPGIAALEKPAATWCRHCSTRSACDNYDNRPDECRDFFCHYLFDPKLGDAWKPAKSKLLLVLGADGRRLTIFVDPKRPRAWREEPFYSQIKAWALMGLAEGAQVIVDIKSRLTLVLPDREIDFGKVQANEEIVTTLETTPSGLKADAYLRKR